MNCGITSADMDGRLDVCAQADPNLGNLRAAKDTYGWFWVASRPVRPTDSLGVYRFAPRSEDKFTFNHDAILKWFNLKFQIRGNWAMEGNVMVNIFDWWWTDRVTVNGEQRILAEAMKEEFEMYRFHLRDRGRAKRMGWARGQVHSLSQQIMRMDPVYYRLYCALRPDHAWRLITYPYYCKHAVPGDKTFFRHIDVNVEQLLSIGRGRTMIQGTASLDDEEESDCTVIIPKMHRYLQQWRDRVEARNPDKSVLNAAVSRIEREHWNDEDAEFFDTDWTPTPCKAGEVRVTDPGLPHGSTGPATMVRRTMLPWYCAIQDDHSTMEVPEMGTWTELSTAHRDLLMGPYSPSGKPNTFGAVPYPFPAATHLPITSALSLALVGARRWTQPAVQRERDTVLGSDESAAESYVVDWREKALQHFGSAFEEMVAAEKKTFGEKSYFINREAGTLAEVAEESDPDPSALQDNEDGEAHGNE